MSNPFPCASPDGGCSTHFECLQKGICQFKYRAAVAVPPPSEAAAMAALVADTLKDRQSIYGSPTVNFERIADLLWILMGPASNMRVFSRPPTAVEVGYIQICIKLGRLMQSPKHGDSIHDLAGYAECIKQILKEEKEND